MGPQGVGASTRVRRGGLVAAVVVVALVATVVMLGRTESLIGGAVDPGAVSSRDQHVELSTGDGDRAAVVAASTRPGSGEARGGGQLLRLSIERPEPRLREITVRLDPQRAGVTPDRVLLEPPGGDWPAFEYGLTSDGQLELHAAGLDFATTTLTFWVPGEAFETERIDDLGVDDLDEPDGTLPVDVELRLADGPFGFGGLQGRAGFRLPFGPDRDTDGGS